MQHLGKALLLGSVMAGPALADVLSPYTAWSNGPSADAGAFPIGVWYQWTGRSNFYKSVGINMIVGGDVDEADFANLKSAGMRIVTGQTPTALAHVNDPTIAGWFMT